METVKVFSEQLEKELRIELQEINNERHEQLVAISKSQQILAKHLSKLKEFVRSYKFSDESEEIIFFKEIKPVFASQYYFYEFLFKTKLNEPSMSTETFYRVALEKSQLILTDHREFYAYCVSGLIHLDSKYFVRRKDNSDPNIDEMFSTDHERILSKILSSKMLKDYYLEEIERVNQVDTNNASSLKWTATKTSLIELIYALTSVEAVNYGKVEIKDLAYSFEKLFNINLGNFYRQFQEIRLRKKARTPFLDSLKITLERRIEEL